MANSKALQQLGITVEEEAMLGKFRCLDERGKKTVLACLNHQYSEMPELWARVRRGQSVFRNAGAYGISAVGPTEVEKTTTRKENHQ